MRFNCNSNKEPEISAPLPIKRGWVQRQVAVFEMLAGNTVQQPKQESNKDAVKRKHKELKQHDKQLQRRRRRRR